MAIVTSNGISYFIEDRVKATWDKIIAGNLVKADDDRVYIVDGRERSGKSVFAMQQAAYLDPTFTQNINQRICFTGDAFLKAIRTVERGRAIVFDEAFRGLSSRSAVSKTNKIIVQALMEMGQRNLIVFIVLPSFFMLDIYPAMLRSNCLFHVYRSKKGRRGYFRVYNYNKKAALYKIGLKMGWSYGRPWTKFKGRFYGKYVVDEAAYRQLKANALNEFSGVSGDPVEDKYRARFVSSLMVLKREYNLGTKKIESLLKPYGSDVDFTTIARHIRDYRLKHVV